MIQIISLFMIATQSFAAAPVIPDFKIKVYHGDPAHSDLWALEVAPPAGHHLNLEAPRSVEQGIFKFDRIQESPEKMIFQTDQKTIRSGAVAEVSIFVCDEKKTYCLKKKMSVTLDEKNAGVITEKFSAKKETKVIASPSKSKTSEIFIDNNPALAIREAKQKQKPLLIDFYGIWCPPCNLYNETIFNTKEFAEKTKNFVLLKMDADQEKSFELKSKFKIGGYPTLLIASVSENGSIEELERIVGYYPADEFFSRLALAYQHRNDIPEFRWKGRIEELLMSYLDQKKYDQVIKLSENSKEGKYQIYHWIAESKKSPDFIKDAKNIEQVKKTLAALLENIQDQSSNTLANTVDFLNDEFWLKQDQYMKMASAFIDQLVQRIDANTLFVKGTELTAADLDSLRMDLAETLHQDQMVNEIRKKVIKNYEKLISFFSGHGHTDLRSMNLEYAFLLWKDGRTEDAKKLYEQFIKKFPAEFTFYYAASLMYLTLKDFTQARDLAEKAFQYSYGDNRIRAMDRLVSVMVEQGLKKEAMKRGQDFLKTVKVPQGLSIRTGKYIDHLKTTLAKIEVKK